MMASRLKQPTNDKILNHSNDQLANKYRLHGEYYDQLTKRTISYKLKNTRFGLGLMYLAGVLSAILGVGSGSLKVPALDLAMHMPIKPSSATSDFMIGVTAAASAGAYFARGQINPILASPIALGVIIGAFFGTKLIQKITAKNLQLIFVAILLIVAVEMLNRGLK